MAIDDLVEPTGAAVWALEIADDNGNVKTFIAENRLAARDMLVAEIESEMADATHYLSADVMSVVRECVSRRDYEGAASVITDFTGVTRAVTSYPVTRLKPDAVNELSSSVEGQT